MSADKRAGLGHTRLSVIDIANGSQPMMSQDGRHILVFNGEIYNFRELRARCAQEGYVFTTRSDTEVLLAAYRQWGRDCLAELNGMFAFAVFDTKLRRIFLARDRTGIKPLYYTQQPFGFFFGSELKALLQVGRIPRQLNRRALADFFVLSYPLAPDTCFEGLHELPSASWLEVDGGGLQTQRYWSYSCRNTITDEAVALRTVDRALTDSLREHLESDVPMGALLSGGIDSSLIVAMLATRLGITLDTFTVRFKESSYDESEAAKSVAQQFGTRHHEVTLESTATNFDMIHTVLDQFDQPFGDSSAIPVYLVSKRIRESVKVVLAGDGGDEMFGGYPRFHYADIAKAIGRAPAGALRAAQRSAKAIRRLAPVRSRQLNRLLLAASAKNRRRLVDLSCYTFPEHLGEVLTPELISGIEGHTPTLGPEVANPGGTEFMETTVAAALPGDYLRKVDMMSSAHGLEVRVPFLGRQVLDAAGAIHHDLKYRGTNTKWLLRCLASKFLPDSITSRPKMGFGIPLDSWLGLQGRREVGALLGAANAPVRAIVRAEYLDQLLTSFVTGQRDRSALSRMSLYQQVYFVWSANRWLRRWGVGL